MADRFYSDIGSSPKGSFVPGTSWASPSGLFNSNTATGPFTWSASNSRVTLPASDLADGYLFLARVQTYDTSNGRYTPHARFVLTSGTGNFTSAAAGGYSRDNSENMAYITVWAILDSPSASAEVSFQWKRDTDGPNATDGVQQGAIECVPLYYDSIGIYEGSTSNAGGTAFADIALDTTVVEAGNISRSGNVVTATGDNKWHLVLAGYFNESHSGRTQRVGRLKYNGAGDDHTLGCAYYRNSNNDELGFVCWDLQRTGTANLTVGFEACRGVGVAQYQGGANIDGTTTSVNAANRLAVIELPSSAEGIRGHDSNLAVGSAGINAATTGPVDLNPVRTVDANDAGAFTQASVSAIAVGKSMDALVGANVFCASGIVSTAARWTCAANITKNGAEEERLFHGNYTRNNQSQDTFGQSQQPGGVLAGLVSGDDIGVSVTELAGTEGGGGSQHVVGNSLWALNLDSLAPSSLTYAGSGAPDLPALTSAGSGVRAAQTRSGSGSSDLPALTTTGAGVREAQTRSGSGSADLPALTATGAAGMSVSVSLTTIRMAPAAAKFVVEYDGTSRGADAVVPGAASAFDQIELDRTLTNTGAGPDATIIELNADWSPSVSGGLAGQSYTAARRVNDGTGWTADTYSYSIPALASSGSADLPALTAAGSGVRSAQTRTGSGAPILPALTATGSGVRTGQTFSGSGTADLPALTATGAGVRSAPGRTSSGSPSLPGLTTSGTGSVTTPDASAALTSIRLAPAAAKFAVEYDGTARGADSVVPGSANSGDQVELDRTLSNTGAGADATITGLKADWSPIITGEVPGQGYTAARRVHDGSFWSADTYSYLSPPIAAAGSAGLPAITSTGAGAVTRQTRPASGSPGLPALTASGAGVRSAQTRPGSGAPDLPAMTATGNGLNEPVTPGSGSADLPALTATGAAAVTRQTRAASGTPGLPALTAAGAGAIARQTRSGEGAADLPALTAAGAGVRTAPDRAGSGSPDLPMLTVAGSGTSSGAGETAVLTTIRLAPAAAVFAVEYDGSARGAESVVPLSALSGHQVEVARTLSNDGAGADATIAGLNADWSPIVTGGTPGDSYTAARRVHNGTGWASDTYAYTAPLLAGTGAPEFPALTASGLGTGTQPPQVRAGAGASDLPALTALGAGVTNDVPPAALSTIRLAPEPGKVVFEYEDHPVGLLSLFPAGSVAGDQIRIDRVFVNQDGGDDAVLAGTSDTWEPIWTGGTEGHRHTATFERRVGGVWGPPETYTLIIPIISSGSPDLPALTATGLGALDAQTRAGVGGAMFPALTATGVGADRTQGGAGSPDLPALTATGAGVRTAPPRPGSGATDLPALTATGAGDVFRQKRAGAGVAELPGLTASGSGVNLRQTRLCIGSAQLPALTADGDGKRRVESSGSASLPALTASGSGVAYTPIAADPRGYMVSL